MISKLKTIVPALAVLALASMTTFAQGAASGGILNPSDASWKMITAGFALAIAAAGCASAQGKGLAAACTSTARNPQAGGRIFIMMIIGLALIESMALYVLLIAFKLLG